jgi:hypothetical protein
LIGVLLGCQGKKKKNLEFEYLTREELEDKSLKQLRDMINKMAKREPGSYTNGCSRWTKATSIGFIMTCRGKKKKQKGGGTYNKSGWKFTFY